MKKRLLSLFLVLTAILSLCACRGNFGSVNLKEPIEIPEHGMIEEKTIWQIKEENAIGVFTGRYGDYRYEWTVFGSDITTPKEVSLAIEISQTSEGNFRVILRQARAFGFSALLSVYLNEKWEAQGATAYAGETAIASVSLTGSEATVLNLALDGSIDSFEVRPDERPEEPYIPETEAASEEAGLPSVEPDDYLSKPEAGDNKIYTDGKDKYLTDPVPVGKPQPVEPEQQEVDQTKVNTCTFSIECSTIFNHLEQLAPDKLEMLPSGGVILEKTTVSFNEGESVFDVLQRVCKDYGIHLEASWTPVYNSAYIEGIHNLYEFDCGNLSGWMYCVNGWYPNYGSSRYALKDGDVVQWRYTCDFGHDIGGAEAVGG